MNKFIVIVIAIAVIAAGGYFLLRDGLRDIQPQTGETTETPQQPAAPETQTPPANADQSRIQPMTQPITVIYTDSGFSPKELTITTGETVVFKNQSSKNFWPASAFHPTHKAYPGSDIEKCKTAPAGSLFDACHGIAPGSSWQFRFDIPGNWKYHDHLNSSAFGAVITQ